MSELNKKQLATLGPLLIDQNLLKKVMGSASADLVIAALTIERQKKLPNKLQKAIRMAFKLKNNSTTAQAFTNLVNNQSRNNL